LYSGKIEGFGGGGNTSSYLHITHLSDEVYEWMVYDKEHVRMATLPGMFERTITLGKRLATIILNGANFYFIGSAGKRYI